MLFAVTTIILGTVSYDVQAERDGFLKFRRALTFVRNSWALRIQMEDYGSRCRHVVRP